MTRSTIIAAWIVMLLSPACNRRPADEPGKVTIRFWHSFVASTNPSLQELLREFERTHPGVQVDAQYIPTGDGLIQKLITAVQSGTVPDLSWIHPDFLDKLVESEAVAPLSDFIGGPDSLLRSDLDDIFPPLLEAGTYRGVLYALPMEATSLALVYNRGLFRKAGLDPDHPPETWEELHDFALRMTAASDAEGRRDRYGFFVPVFPASGELNIWMNLQWSPFLWQAGGDELSPDGTEVTFDRPAGVRALRLWKRLYADQEIGKFGIAHDLGFASEKLAMVLDGPWNLPRYRAMQGVEWAVAPLPAGPAGKATYLAGEQLAIFRNSPHPREAWSFVKWIVGKEVQARFSMSSGYLPVRMSVLGMKEYREFLEKDHALKTYVEQMAVGRGRRIVPRHRVEINRFLAEAIEGALVGDRDPARCLQEAAQKSNALLRKNESE